MYQKNQTISTDKDWITIWLFTIIAFIGLVCIFSVEFRTNDDFLKSLFAFNKNYSKQFFYLILCFIIATFILLMDSKIFTATPNILYVVGILLMISTFVVGKTVNGSRSWIPLGFMNLQPVETCKIFVSLALAKYLSRPETDFSKTKSQLIASGICFLPVIFSLLQNETGLALVYFTFLLPMYREGFPPVYLILGVSLGVLLILTLLLPSLHLLIGLTVLAFLSFYFLRLKIKRNRSILMIIFIAWGVSAAFVGLAVPFIFKHVFQKYQADRIFSMVGRDNPYVTADTANLLSPEIQSANKKIKKDTENYNVKQSKIAIGSGGLFGKGFLKGTQTQGDFVPEQHTDFIFTSLGENFGFVGCTILMLLYLALLLRIILIAERQRSTFSRVYAYSVAAIIFFHVAINICMTIGLAPVIGITLPLMSYGGSSLITFTVLIFILVKLDSDRQMVLR
ncbi:MAG: rod shape-determining protein RodA [Sphingobacteriales bacterium]|nr:rod shape-determining protein RodA [Sphingobacteriales bacterium]